MSKPPVEVCISLATPAGCTVKTSESPAGLHCEMVVACPTCGGVAATMHTTNMVPDPDATTWRNALFQCPCGERVVADVPTAWLPRPLVSMRFTIGP